MAERRGRVSRATTETTIEVAVDLDGGDASISTGVPFFDHMLEQVAKHGRLGLTIAARGDLDVDAHHTVEDTGIALGEALTQALGDKRGIARYGDALVPMEESLAQVALDISGRPLLVYEAPLPAETIGQYESGLTPEFLQALARAAGLTLHVRLLAGSNAHHATEAIFKALARALAQAVRFEPGSDSVPSTKGLL
ncbi:MAG: imidazoleglycerol-phosphate dehydratase HisB [Actinomycetota bacterium]|nr:imidazoleglycerol-phosphate dehydratase HisB [Actinomycetota bacterium]